MITVLVALFQCMRTPERRGALPLALLAGAMLLSLLVVVVFLAVTSDPVSHPLWGMLQWSL